MSHIILYLLFFKKNSCSKPTIGHTKSNFFKPIAGVSQGSILSPILFNIFISNIPTTNNCTNYLYADDLAFAASARSPSSIIKALNGTLHTPSSAIDGSLKQTQINKSLRKLPSNGVSFMQGNITWKDQVKYLGVYLEKTHVI